MRCSDVTRYFEALTPDQLELTHGVPDEVIEHLDRCPDCFPKCHEILALIRPWFAGTLPIGAIQQVRYHCERCDRCYRAYDTEAQSTLAVAELRANPVEVTPTVRAVNGNVLKSSTVVN